MYIDKLHMQQNTCNITYTNAGDMEATYISSMDTYRVSFRNIAKSYGLSAKPSITTTHISTYIRYQRRVQNLLYTVMVKQHSSL